MIAPSGHKEQARQTLEIMECLSIEELYACIHKDKERAKREEGKDGNAFTEVQKPNQENLRSTAPAPRDTPVVPVAAARDKQEFLTLTQLYANRRRALVT